MKLIKLFEMSNDDKNYVYEIASSAPVAELKEQSATLFKDKIPINDRWFTGRSDEGAKITLPDLRIYQYGMDLQANRS